MEKERKYFGDAQTGRLNSDDANSFVGVNEWVNMSNLRSGSTDKGVIGTLESIGSNVLISAAQPSAVFLEIGSVEEQARNRFCYFKFNTTGIADRIICYDDNVGIEYVVLTSSQVTGGLNFSKDSIIHGARIIDGMLYWVDSTINQPRKINIDSAIKGNDPSYVTDEVAYSFPLNFSEITLIKPPPPLAPNIQKAVDGFFQNNFIANDSFMFSFQYIWYDNERTVLGTYSPSSRLNKVTDTENVIIVTMDSLEQVPQTVRLVRLIVRFSNSNNAFVVKIWDKNNVAEAAEIAAQNAGTTPLTFNFYNNITGPGIPSAPVNLVLKPFDSVPIYSETLEAFRNRIGLGNNTEGYDTPTTTSLDISLAEIDISSATFRKQLIGVSLSWLLPNRGYSAWYVFLTEVVPTGYYEITSTVQTNNSFNPPALGVAPVTVAFSGLNFRGANQSEVVAYVRGTLGNPNIQLANTFNFLTDPIAGYTTITGLSVQTFDIFKTQAQYWAGVVFYDFAMRKCGVVTNDGLLFEIPTRDFDFTNAVNGAVWTLSNANAINEIPDWAYFYTPVRTLNLRTRYFIQSFTDAAKYATKDTSGNYVFSSNTFVTGSVGIALNTTALVQSGLGYVFTPFDVCILTMDDDTVNILPVVGQDGNYIIVKAVDLGDLSNRQFVFEIFTPYQTSEQEPFYEVGQMYRVLNPGTGLRSYDVLSDIFVPDSYVLTRNYNNVTYFAEAMSPNDLFFSNWFNDAGKVNLITTLGQVVKTNSISYSNNFIANTSINGLSTFDALDERSVPLECGPITKLQLTSKVQEELGVILAALCENEFVSIYVGEVQQFGSTRPTALVSTEEVIGTMNVLKGSYGCTNAEGVVEYRGNIYYPSASSGKWIQYSANGLFPISNYKMTRFWGQWFQQFSSMTSEQIEALGGRPFVFATVDPYHGELLISIPKLMNVPPKGYLPDYTVLPNETKTTFNIRQSYSLGSVISFYYGLYVYISNASPAGYYLLPFSEIYSSSPVPDVPTDPSYNFTGLPFRGSTIDDVLFNTRPSGAALLSDEASVSSTTVIIGVISKTVYPFDILDFQDKVMVYELDRGVGLPKWKGSYSFYTEGFITLFNKLYSFKQGLLYLHNQTTSYNNFYGVSNQSKVMFISNQNPSLPKVYNNISLKTNFKPSLTYFYSRSPYQQASDLVDFDYADKEGILYATLYRNKLVPTATGYTQDGLLTGEKVRTAELMVMIQFEVDTTPVEFEFVSIGFDLSRGQKI